MLHEVPNQIESVTSANDVELLPYLSAEKADERERQLTRLLWDIAKPIAARTINRKIATTFNHTQRQLRRDAASDICSNTIERLLKKLTALKESPDYKPIGNYGGYVTRVAEAAYLDFLEQVKAFDNIQTIDYSTDVETAIDTSQSLIETAEVSQKLTRVWSEIAELSLKQRRVFLLGMRTEKGTGDIWMFITYGVAEYQEILKMLEVEAEWLESHWKRLPLDDIEIGKLVGSNQQQVSNIRKAVMERFARRLKS